MKPGRKSLELLLTRSSIQLSPAQLDQLWAYHNLLRSADALLNLTRIRNFENMVLKHYVDSLLVLRFVPDLPAPLLDMGSGPGLPGIPLKIARPDLPMILAEPRAQRAQFLDEVCEALALHNIEVYAGKVGPRFPRHVRGVITRAVGSIPETLDRIVHILQPGGLALFMKGPDCQREIQEQAARSSPDFQLAADHDYALPHSPHLRRLVIYKRTDHVAPAAAISMPPLEHHSLVREVTSAANPHFKLCRELLAGKGIRKHNLALLAGSKIVAEVTDRFQDRVQAWITDPEGPPPPRQDWLWLRLSKPLFQELDLSGTHAPLVQVLVPSIPVWDPSAPWPPGCTLFIPFQDPENVGAAVRSAAALGASRIVLTREAAHPFHPRSSRAAGPALLQIPFEQGPSINDLDTSASLAPIITLSAEGRDLGDPWPESFGLLPGLEGPGLPAALRGSTSTRRIPIQPGVESLNAAAAVAVALYDWRLRSGTLPPIPSAQELRGDAVDRHDRDG